MGHYFLDTQYVPELLPVRGPLEVCLGLREHLLLAQGAGAAYLFQHGRGYTLVFRWLLL